MQVREGHAGRAVAHVVVHLHILARLPSGAGQAHVQRDRLRSQGVAGRVGDLGLVRENMVGSKGLSDTWVACCRSMCASPRRLSGG